MKILRMHASFGGLRQELVLQDGLNVLTQPNESGKSTWCAFLVAMLYGINSSERAGKGKLPAKQRYQPWNGGMMEGTLELEWQGQHITIERSSTKTAPMSRFRAYDTQSGAPIAGMTAENCGVLLTGVERSVFTRSAFIGQSALGVTPDAALEQRLHAMVTTGDESASYLALHDRLTAERNHLKYNKSGRLPAAEAELRQVKQQLSDLHDLSGDYMSLSAEQRRWEQTRSRNSAILAQIRRARDRKKLRQLLEAEQQAETLRKEREAAEQRAAQLPPAQELEELHSLSRSLENEAYALAMEEAVRQPTEQPLPIFEGKSAEEAKQEALSAVKRLRAAEECRPPQRWIVLLCAALTAAALVFGILNGKVVAFLPSLLCAAALLGTLLWNRKQAQRFAAADAAAKQILANYGAADAEAITEAAAHYGAQLAGEQAAAQAHLAEKQAFAQREQALLERVCRFAPECRALREVQPILEQALAQQRELEALSRSARQAEQYAAQLRLLAADAKADEADEEFDESRYNVPRLQQEQSFAEHRCLELHGEMEKCQGKISMLGDRAELEARQEELTEQCDRWRMEYDALTLALTLLQRANEQLAQRFAPQISKLAGELFSELTDGRYDALLLDQKLEVSARPSGDVLLRPSLALSCGTVDQLYLSLRLAIAKLLTAQTPLILDDALVNFDDARACAALRVLRREAQTRQVLLFTCHGREQQMLAQMA